MSLTRTHPLEEPVIKTITLLTRIESMSPEEFSTYWSTVHGPLVGELPSVLRYVRNHIVSASARQAFPSQDYAVDGVVEEFWFEGEEAKNVAFASRQGQELLKDAENFVERITVFIVHENEVVPMQA